MKQPILVSSFVISFIGLLSIGKGQEIPISSESGKNSLSFVDLDGEKERQVVVDRQEGQYLGHPTTVLLEDKKTILCVYPKGHGRGPILFRKSIDEGLTWSLPLPTPENWQTSLETPTIHRVVDASGKKRLIVWSGLYPARLSISEDDGQNWTPLKAAGDWGGIVVMSAVLAVEKPGKYMALFHDDGRYFNPAANTKNKPDAKTPAQFTLYKTLSEDGGLTWSFPEAIYSSNQVHLCEPGAIRSPDGKQIAVLLRENRRVKNSHIIISEDEGRHWSEPRELPLPLTGDRHTAVYAPDGRLFVSFRDMAKDSPTKGDWCGWVGTYSDIIEGRDGQYRVRLKKNYKGFDCGYPGVEIVEDGTIVTTTYGHWTPKEQPYILSIRLKLSELDARSNSAAPR